MRKGALIIFILFVVTVALGCSSGQKPAITMGRITVTPKEFNSAFNKSVYAGSDSEETRKQFLDNYINRKLILSEAVREGLDKDPEFLESIQYFWEQSLLKIFLNKKMKELSAEIEVTDREIRDYYTFHREDFPDKGISAVYDQIKLQLYVEKQGEVLDEWIRSLREKSKIKVDYKRLGLE